MAFASSKRVGVSDISWILFPGGFAPRYFAMLSVDIFEAALDESSDQKCETIFVAAGFIGLEDCWKDVERRWLEVLKKHGMQYFKSKEWKSLTGQFRKFRSNAYPKPLGGQTADAVREELVTIILSSNLIGFAVGILMKDYNEVLQKMAASRVFYNDDPHVEAYYSLMHEIVRTVRRKAKGKSVAIVYDDSTYSQKVEHAFKALKKIHPSIGSSLRTFLPLSDKDHVPLQAADILANLIKTTFEKWFENGRPALIPLDKRWRKNVHFVGKFDREHMVYTTLRNLEKQEV